MMQHIAPEIVERTRRFERLWFGDLSLLAQVDASNAAAFSAGVEAMKADFRRLETLGRPVVAALNGTALTASRILGPAIAAPLLAVEALMVQLRPQAEGR